MKTFNKQILEAINKGIQLALDDYEDDELSLSSKHNIVKNNKRFIKDQLDLYEYVVDLGLPSRTLWCKNNLGADCGDIAQEWFGSYYAWGETEEKEKFNELTYKFTGKMNKYNKYDNIINLEPEDDAAHQNMHCCNYKFRIPTKWQCEELIEYTKQVWIKNYNDIEGLNGCRYISKINDEEIFIPAAGYKYWAGAEGAGTKAKIMSSTNALDKGRKDCCWSLQADYDKGFDTMTGVYINWCNYRSNGLPIRPVYNQK